MGAWAAFMPFHTGATSPRYGEALLWGLPMYIYMVVGFCAVTISFIKFVQRYYPNLTKSAALAISFLVITVLDFLVEVPAIWITHAYMYSKTFGPLTLFAGELHQFPIYEATGVGLIGMCGTAIWLSAAGDPNEVSFIERGYEKFPQLLQTPVRILAYIGALFIIILLTYHIPFNWWGVIGNCTIELPSYMQVPLAGGFN